MAKKKNKELNVAPFYEAALEKHNDYVSTLEITEIIRLYFQNFTYLEMALQDLIGYPDHIRLKFFKIHLEKATFFISIDNLYRQLEIQLLKNPVEHNEKLFNVISIKINEIENLLFDELFITKYNNLKTEKINIPFTEILLVFNLFTHENITIETLYNATLNLFNDAKNRINNLF